MKLIKVTIDPAGYDTMKRAADYKRLPLSLWARAVLLDEARSLAHKELCETPKAQGFKWNKKPCTEAEYLAYKAQADGVARAVDKLAGADRWEP